MRQLNEYYANVQMSIIELFEVFVEDPSESSEILEIIQELADWIHGSDEISEQNQRIYLGKLSKSITKMKKLENKGLQLKSDLIRNGWLEFGDVFTLEDADKFIRELKAIEADLLETDLTIDYGQDILDVYIPALESAIQTFRDLNNNKFGSLLQTENLMSEVNDVEMTLGETMDVYLIEPLNMVIDYDLVGEWEEFEYDLGVIRNTVNTLKSLNQKVSRLESELDKADWLRLGIDNLEDSPDKFISRLSHCNMMVNTDWENQLHDMDLFIDELIPHAEMLISLFTDVLNKKYGDNPLNENKNMLINKNKLRKLNENFFELEDNFLVNESRVSREYVIDWVEENKGKVSPQSIRTYQKNKHEVLNRLIENYDMDDVNEIEQAFNHLDSEFDDVLANIDDLSEDDFDNIAAVMASNMEKVNKKAKKIKSKRK